MDFSIKYKEIRNFYSQRGFAGRMGFGKKPSILVVDFSKGFTDERSPFGCNLDSQIRNSIRILREGRKIGVPIIFTTVAYNEGLKDAGLWIKKIPSLKVLTENSSWVELDPRLERRPDEIILVKKFASAFFGTNLSSLLTSQNIDTLIIIGCTSSGCIRATAIDSMQNGYYTIIPAECVGDRDEIPHEANLFDIDSKYGDVVTTEDVLQYLQTLKH